MPKPELTIKDARHISKITSAWSKTGDALNGFYSEDERVDEDSFYKSLAKVMSYNDYDSGRESMGTFLFMCMAGQKNEDGTPKYDIKDIYEPDKLLEEKIELRQELEELLTPAPEDATKEKQDEVIANRKLVDTYFSDGIKRSCERLSEFASRSVKKHDMAELMKPESAVISKLLIIALTNFIEKSKKNAAAPNVPMSDDIVTRLKDLDFDINEYANNYVGMATYGGHLGQTMGNLHMHVDGTALNGLIGIEEYIGFSIIMDKYRKNPNAQITKIFESSTKKQIEQRADEGQKISIDDFTPNEMVYYLTSPMNDLVDGREIDEIGESRRLTEDYLKKNRNNPSVQQKKQFIEGFCDIMTNSTDTEYIYGLSVMYMNGRLYPNTSFSADLNMNETRVSVPGKPDEIKHIASIDNASIKFDNILDRKSVLKEAFLSDLDIAPYSYAPINDEDKEISEINAERISTINELKNTIDSLKPVAGASHEWKEMLYVVGRAEKICEEYQKKYESFGEETDKAEKRAALEEVTSAMELARDAAHNYVVHKLDSGKYTDGKDYQRLQVAKKLENFGKQQSTYLNYKATEKLNSVQEDEGYFNEEAIASDAENINKYSAELFDLGQKTTFRSNEFKEMMNGIHQLQNQQIQIAKSNGYNAENDTLYFGGPDEDGVYRKGYIDRAIERIDAYITHRHKEGIDRDLYAKRVDVASRLKRYLETIKAGADRTREDRFEEHANKKRADKNQADFKLKYDEAKKVLSDTYNTIYDEVPANKISAVKDAICTMYVYQKFKNETELVKDEKIKSYQALTITAVNEGRYNNLINDFKAKQTEKDSFVNRNAGKMSSILNILKDNIFSKTIQEIDKELEERKPISEVKSFISVQNLSKRAIVNCRTTANEMPEGKIDVHFLSNFIVHRSLLVALDNIAKLPANSQSAKSELSNIISISAEDRKIDNMAEKIRYSNEFRAVIERYNGQKQLGDKLEEVYQDYAQLSSYTKHHGAMPEDVDKYLNEVRAKNSAPSKPEEKSNNANAIENEANKNIVRSM